MTVSAVMPEPLGLIAHYNLLERIDPSGPGDLFRARDTHRGRTVAVRLLPPGFIGDQAAVNGLIAQTAAIRSLSHPNVTTLFDIGEHDGRVYLVFEFLKGRSLRAEMAGQMMNVRRAVEIAVHIADAVADAHAAGFAHGGLSPDTVVITEKGQAKIPAFELATREGFDDTAGDGRLRDYESPEEAAGGTPDDRSDVFSVGAILFEMLTARRPQLRGSAAPSATNAAVPASLDRIVLQAVAPNPDLRCRSAAALAAELRTVLASLNASESPAEEPDEAVAAPAPRNGSMVVLAVVILAAVALLVWFSSGSW